MRSQEHHLLQCKVTECAFFRPLISNICIFFSTTVPEPTADVDDSVSIWGDDSF